MCPSTYDVRLEADYGDGTAQFSRRSRTALRDTVRFQRPLCPQTLRVRGQVSSVTSGAVERSSTGSSLWQVIRCSEMTAAEKIEVAAMADSFPAANRRLTTSDTAEKLPKADRDVMLQDLLRASKTAADSTKHRVAYANADAAPQQIVLAQRSDTVIAQVGFNYVLCLLARNRYTGLVIVCDGDVVACEAPRARMQSERSG